MIENKHMSLLGTKAKDAVTGFHGVITTLSYDLYGCIQVVITPPTGKDGQTKEGHWFDVTRLIITDHTPVMVLPDFNAGYIAEGRKGCSNKPMP